MRRLCRFVIPTITLSAPLVNPYLTNLRTGQFLKFNYTLNTGDLPVVVAGYNGPSQTVVAGPVDAVTNQALACRALFEQWGWGGKDYAALSASGVDRRAIRPLQALNAAPDEVMLLHYSGYARGLERLFDSRRQSVLISHNITPARFFWDNDPLAAVRCELGREQLAELSRGVATLAGVSAYNANELRLMSGRTAAVIPVLFERDRLPPAGDPPTGPPTVLFVGRLAPHKRQDLVIQAFAAYRQAWAKSDCTAEAQVDTATPVKLIGGVNDPAQSADVMEQTWRVFFPDAELTILPDAGHYPMFESPVSLATSIEEFLGRN